jgi:hypothetical protein
MRLLHAAPLSKTTIGRRSPRALIDRLHKRILQRRVLGKSVETTMFIVCECLKASCIVCAVA